MKDLLSRSEACLRRIAQGESAAAYLIQFIYHFYANKYVQATVSIVGTVLIAMFIGISYYGVFFWITSVFYIISTFLIVWANQHIQEKIRDTSQFQYALHEISKVLRAWAFAMQRSAKSFSTMDIKRDFVGTERVLSTIDFQAAAFTVCEQLNAYLTKSCKPDDVYITVYQKEYDGEKWICRMIAHSCDHEPTSYGIPYEIPPFSKELLSKIEYHTYLFASGNKDINVLPDHESVKKAFKTHEGCEAREERIQQYVCVPISPAKIGVTFLLQVDTTVPKLFGKNELAVIDFSKNTIYPFAQFLHAVYEQERTIQQLIKI